MRRRKKRHHQLHERRSVGWPRVHAVSAATLAIDQTPALQHTDGLAHHLLSYPIALAQLVLSAHPHRPIAVCARYLLRQRACKCVRSTATDDAGRSILRITPGYSTFKSAQGC